MNYQKLNIYVGWFTFLVASVVYLMTIEPTASFWDCGEFIATGYKLEVGHPPGAPFFMLLTRFFSLFAMGNVEKVALMANIMSALASSFTILFLFWTITHLAKKFFAKGEELTQGQGFAIIGSALIGSLAYTFSDTFWFSAVEGEVYATSSLITAVVFWAIFKWENIAHEKHADRWIVFIMYIVGLSIGVHLLNLLAIPAIALVYYFKKYKVTKKGVIASLALSFLFLGFVMWGVIPGTVKIAFIFDRLFVNSFGMPFNSGTIFFAVLIAIILAVAIYITRQKNMQLLNTVVIAFTVMMIGYSSYGVILIRSNATPPIDQNNPDNPYSLLSYLNREQYGSNPLFSGQYYNTPIDVKNPYKYGPDVWYKKDGKYVKKDKPKFEYNYNPKMTTFFPRMWSSQQHHVEAYQDWAQIKGRKVKALNNQGEMQTFVKPTFSENLRYFFRYQVIHMYGRYFMWNFSGRQNDFQGHGGPMKGNWITGISAIDEHKIGPTDNLPSKYKDNKANNKYYMLPLILGFIGLVFHFSRDNKNFWVVMSLFVLTGLAIVVYLNQYPHQPRERDYAFAGSFYAFAIWIGLGVLGIYEWIKKYVNQESSAVIATCIGLVIPGLLAAENWDDHDRSNRYVARDFAYNYLNSCDKDAVIFTNGDNDTFPLWYIQEVEGVRTDVRVICLPYLITDWYIDQMKSKYYDSEPVPFSMEKNQYRSGVRDQVPVIEKFKEAELRKAINFVASDDQRTKYPLQAGEFTDYFPTKTVKITIDSADVVNKGVVKPEDANEIVDEMKWDLSARYLMKNDLMILDLLGNANWERPIYFVAPGSGNGSNLRDYFQAEGFASKVVPIKTPFDYKSVGRIDTEILYDNLMNKFKWGNIGEPDVYLDENTRRTIRIVKVRTNFGRLAKALAQEGDKERAQEVIKRGLEVLPESQIPFDYYDAHFIEAFFEVGMEEEGKEIAEKIVDDAFKDLLFYIKMDGKFGKVNESDKQLAMVTIQWLGETANRYNQKELAEKIDNVMKEAFGMYSR